MTSDCNGNTEAGNEKLCDPAVRVSAAGFKQETHGRFYSTLCSVVRADQHFDSCHCIYFILFVFDAKARVRRVLEVHALAFLAACLPGEWMQRWKSFLADLTLYVCVCSLYSLQPETSLI